MSIVTRTYVIAANSSVSFQRKADFLRCLSSTAPVTVEFDNGDGGDLEGGLAYFPEGGFQTARILNSGAASVTIQIAVGKGTMEDNRATVNTGQTLPVRQGAPDVVTTIPALVGAGPGYAVAANANPLRHELIIANTLSGAIYLSGDGLTYGAKIDAGAQVVLTTQAKVWLYNPSGAVSGTLHLTSLEWSS